MKSLAFSLLLLAFCSGCTLKNDKIRIFGEFPSDNNAVVKIIDDRNGSIKMVNLKGHKFSVEMENVESGFYYFQLTMPLTKNDVRLSNVKTRYGKLIKIIHPRLISFKLYVNPEIDSLYQLKLVENIQTSEIDTMRARLFNALRFDILTKCNDTKVYRELDKITKKYHELGRILKDSLNKKADFYLQTNQLDHYSNTMDSILSYWNNNLRLKMIFEYKGFMSKNLNSVITPYLIDQSSDLIQNADFYLSILNKLGGTAKGSSYEKSARNRIESVKNVKVGKKLPAPHGENTEEKTFKLDPSKSKYTLVEFWASWCVPCRQNNPKLINIYNKYSRKDFNIIGVSIDTDREKWIEAIKVDQLSWENISDLLPIDRSANTSRFNVFSIPDNFLIDAQGIIVKRNVSAEGIVKILSKQN